MKKEWEKEFEKEYQKSQETKPAKEEEEEVSNRYYKEEKPQEEIFEEFTEYKKWKQIAENEFSTQEDLFN